MQRINKLIIKNYKFFYGEHIIDFGGKNILLYGENGSGKSSMYWALHAFLQSIFKQSPKPILNYFDPKEADNLRNKYADDNEESSITLEFDNGVTKKISNAGIDIKNDEKDILVQEASLGSDFIDYRVLSSIFLFSRKEKIDLFGFFEHNLLPYINFKETFTTLNGTQGSKNAAEFWAYLGSSISIYDYIEGDETLKKFEPIVHLFNDGFKSYLDGITEDMNTYLQKKFNQPIKVKLSYVPTEALEQDIDEGKRLVTLAAKPKILLNVELLSNKLNENKKPIINPQSFLNESKLTALALSMRFAILDEKFVKEYPKILVLDDMLMSMDMSNRDLILKVIIETYAKDYQILFFTHQRGLFEDAKNFITQYYFELAEKEGQSEVNAKIEWKKSWNLLEMYESTNINGIPIPKILPHESNIQKAYYYFKEHIDYNACGNNLRAALEGFFTEFLPHNFRDKSKSGAMLDALLEDAKTYFEHVGFDSNIISQLKRYLKRSLNKASHHNPKTEFYKDELREVFKLYEKLNALKNSPVLKTNDLLKFTITTQSKNIYEYTVKLMDCIRLYSNGDSESYFLDKDKRSYGMISYAKNNTIINVNGEKSNLTLQELYDFTLKLLTTKEEVIVEVDMYDVFKDENGVSLRNLKKY